MDELSLGICSICKKYMNDPRILPCAHSFCLKCLESSTSKDPSKCPTCQLEFHIPQGGLEDLKKNEFIEQLNSLKEKIIKCDSCKDNQAIKFCADCSFNYCSTCLEHHARIPTARNHHLQPATSTKVEINVNKYSKCVEHSELMTLMCQNCKIVMCSHCLTLKHKNHYFLHMSEYYHFKRGRFEEHLKKKEQTLQHVIKNMRSSEDMKRDIELKASNLKKEIQQRGEDAKKIIDSIVAAFNQNIDDELKLHRQIADEVLVELKKIGKNLSEQIENLKLKLKNLSYANVIQIELDSFIQIENIPNYSEKFSKSFHFDEDLNKIENLFGRLHKEPFLRLVKEDTLDSNIELITSYKGDFYGLEKLKDGLFKIKMCFGSSENISYIKFHKHLVEFHNLLVIDDMFFVSGTCGKGYHYIIKVHKSVENRNSFNIYYNHPINEQFCRLGMSKSIWGNILVNLFNKIVLVSPNGVVMKRIFLPFHIYEAVQLTNESYAVCCDGDARIIDINDDILVRHSYGSSENRLKLALSSSTRRMAKDIHGNIYVYDERTCKVFILDRSLRIKSSFAVKSRLREIIYDEVTNILVISCEDKSFLTYAL